MAAGIVGNIEKGQKRPRRRKLKIGSERPPIAAETTQDGTNRCGKANGSETNEEQMEKSGELGLAGPQPEKPYFFYMPKYFIHKMTAAIAAAAVRKLRKKERAAIKAKNAWSTRRKHGPGIVKLVVGLRFGEVGSLQPTDWRYS